MKERNVTVTLDKAKEWFNSGNATLREVALQAFSKEELNPFDFTKIKTFRDALNALDYSGYDMQKIMDKAKNISYYSRASAAAFKLDIVRRALNLGQDLSLTKDPEHSYIYYPINPFTTKSSTYYEKELASCDREIIGKIKTEGKEYYVFGGGVGMTGSKGLGSFMPDDGVGFANAYFGFLGCANVDIARHFSKYFGMLITEAKYASIIKDFEIIESKYSI